MRLANYAQVTCLDGVGERTLLSISMIRRVLGLLNILGIVFADDAFARSKLAKAKLQKALGLRLGKQWRSTPMRLSFK